jgi:hypothetical protein
MTRKKAIHRSRRAGRPRFMSGHRFRGKKQNRFAYLGLCPPTLGRSQIKLFSQCQKPRNPRPLASACAPTAGTCASSKLIAPPRSTFVSARQQIPRSPSIRVCPCFSAQATSSSPHLNTVQHPFISRAQLPEIFLRRDKYKVQKPPLRIGQRHQPIALRKWPPILFNG